MPRRTNQEQERGYLRSFWDQVRVLQADHAAAISLFAYPTDRPGVWNWRLVFTPIVENAENPVGSAAVQFVFPTAENVGLAGYLWNQSMKLADVVADYSGPRKPHQRSKK